MGFMMGKSSKSTSTSSAVYDSSTHNEDRKVAQQGRDLQTFGENAHVDYKINGFTGKDIGDMFAGLTHDSAFARTDAGAGAAAMSGGAAPGNVVAAGGGIAKPALIVGAGVLVLGLVVVLVMRKR